MPYLVFRPHVIDGDLVVPAFLSRLGVGVDIRPHIGAEMNECAAHQSVFIGRERLTR